MRQVDIILKLRIIEIFTKLKALVNDHCPLFLSIEH